MQRRNTTLLLGFGLIVLILVTSTQTTEICSDQRVETYNYRLNGTFAQILYATDDKQDIYIRTYSSGNIYRSQNGGETWEPQMEKMKGFYDPSIVYEPENLSGVTDMKKGATDGLIYFIGPGYIYWVTLGDGTYKDYPLGRDLLLGLAPHPTNPDLVLRSCLIDSCKDPSTNCISRLEVSNEQGVENSWKLVREEVFEFSWGEGNQIYMIGVAEGERPFLSYMNVPKGERYMYITDDFGATLSQQAGPGFYDFRFTQGVIYVFSWDPETSQESVYISDDFGQSYVPVEFNQENAKLHYNATRHMLLDSSEGVSFITMCSDEGSMMGDMFQSPTSDGHYWLTFPHHRLQCDSFFDTADFSLIQGMNGIYIANGYNLTDYRPEIDEIEDFIQTSITFNKGGEWQHLPPVSDNCKSTPECKLNLVDKSDKKYSVKIQSTAEAIGLVTGVGTEGEFRGGVSHPMDTYLSRNGGFSWEKIRDGATKLFLSPRGDLIVGVANQETSELFWSWDQGATWESCDFGVTLLPIEWRFASGDPSLKRILLIGQTSRSEAHVVLFDFSLVLPRDCVNFESPNLPESDYETFIPEAEGSCLLGERVSYTRRKRTSTCISLQNEVSTILGSCECTREDYTCAGECFQEVHLSESEKQQLGFSFGCVNVCEGEPNDPQAPPESCELGTATSYEQVSGYIRVEDDSCVGGLDLDQPQVVPCPESIYASSAENDSVRSQDDPDGDSSQDDDPNVDGSGNSQMTSGDQGEVPESDEGWWWIVAVSVIVTAFVVFSVVGAIVFYRFEPKLQGLFEVHVLPIWRKPRTGGGDGSSYMKLDEMGSQAGSVFDLEDLAWEDNKPVRSSFKSTTLGPLPELDDLDDGLEYTEFPPYRENED